MHPGWREEFLKLEPTFDWLEPHPEPTFGWLEPHPEPTFDWLKPHPEPTFDTAPELIILQ